MFKMQFFQHSILLNKKKEKTHGFDTLPLGRNTNSLFHPLYFALCSTNYVMQCV